MTSSPVTAIGRLAFRVEGDFWSAYYAQTGTMDGAILLGSIRMSIVTADATAKQNFIELMMELMKAAFAQIVKDVAGGAAITEWNEPETAPENERSGSA